MHKLYNLLFARRRRYAGAPSVILTAPRALCINETKIKQYRTKRIVIFRFEHLLFTSMLRATGGAALGSGVWAWARRAMLLAMALLRFPVVRPCITPVLPLRFDGFGGVAVALKSSLYRSSNTSSLAADAAASL